MKSHLCVCLKQETMITLENADYYINISSDGRRQPFSSVYDGIFVYFHYYKWDRAVAAAGIS